MLADGNYRANLKLAIKYEGGVTLYKEIVFFYSSHEKRGCMHIIIKN
jgi:hypothetical protein